MLQNFVWRGMQANRTTCLLPGRVLSTLGAGGLSIQRIPKHIKKADKAPEGYGCTLCRAGLQKFGYRDVLLLRQFVTPQGLLLGRRSTGICPKMQRRIVKAIRRSRKAGLLPNFKASPNEET